MEVIIILIGIVIDRISKILSITNLKDANEVEIVKDFFGFYYLENRGAAFSILKGKVPLLVTFTVIIAIGMMVFLFKERKKLSKLEILSLSLIISGAVGNIIDRIYYGYVVDFIKVHFKNQYVFPIFNVADILVTTGVVLLIFATLKGEKNGR